MMKGHRQALIAASFAAGALAARQVCAAIIRVGDQRTPTLAAAIAAVPAIRAGLHTGEQVEIVLPRGVGRLAGPVRIDAAHGGTAAAPLVIRGEGAAATRLVGTVVLALRPLVPRDTGGRAMPSWARAADLAGLSFEGIVRRGAYADTQFAGIELFQGSVRLAPSRWPEAGYAIGAASGTNIDGPSVVVPAGHAAAWRREPSLWAAGYWGADWAFELAPVAGTAPDGGSIRLAPLQGRQPPRANVRYYVVNALAELRRPGSYVVDPTKHVAIILPLGGEQVEAAVAPSLLVIEGARNITIKGIAFDRTLGPAVQVLNGSDIRFVNCAFRQTGGAGVTVIGGRSVRFTRSVIAATAETGLILSGGDRATLTPANHAFVDGVIANFGEENPSYRPGVLLQGVGNELRGSLITGGGHSAVMLSGNDHVVAGNEIADVLNDTEDAGAIYMGADWSQRGITVTSNYIHGLGGTRHTRFLTAVYLDDQFSGVTVSSNVLVGGDYGVVIGGGRDNRVVRNLIVDASRGGIHFDARGLAGQRDRSPEFAAKLSLVPATGPVWLARYPELRFLTHDRFGAPDSNVAAFNLVIGAAVVVAAPPSTASLLLTTGNIGRSEPVSAKPATLVSLIDQMPAGQRPKLSNRAAVLSALLPLRGLPER